MTTITKQVKQGDSVSIQATPKTGYTFSGWTSGAGDSRISTDNPYTFTPNADTSINAVFSEATPIISWVGNPGNLVIKNSNGQTHNLWSAAGTNKYFGDVEGFGADDIVSVYINDPDSTSRIPTTTWLTSINMNGLTNLTLQKRSFAYCTGLTSVVLPNSSYSIADTVSGTSGAFQGCTSLSSLSLGGCTSIGSYSFQGCTSLGTVNLPSSCTSIGNHAFESCSSLQTLNFASSGSSLSIGILAFSNCDIRSIEFPSYLTEIVESTYGTCVDIANRPNKNNACNPFQGNTNLTSITKTINTGRYRAEGNCLIDSQYLPNAASGDTSYYNAVIIGCKNSIIPDTGSSPSRIPGAIGAAAFMNMGITSITIPERIRYIESYAFYNNRNLSSISFSPDTGIIVNPYLRICGNAFGYCTSLSTITFPSRLKQFGNTYANGSSTYYSPDVFYNCSALRTAHLESIATPPSIISGPSFSGENLFPSTIEKIYVKPGTMQAYQSDSKWAYWYNQKKLYIGIGISSDVSPAGSSTVSKSSDSVEFQSDSAAPVVILTATPNTGYTFSSWKRGSTVLSTSNPYTATVVDDGTGIDEFTALSTVASYSISASINPSGGGTVSGTGTYNYGDSCTVSATANTGYNFVNWTEGGSTVSSSSSYTFTVSQARTLVANFELQTITISAGPNTSGYGTVSGNSGTYSYGDTVSLTATAASGYEFSEWTENGTTVSTSSTYSFTATQDRTLVAVFAAIAPATPLTITTRGTGSVILTNNSDETYTWNLASGTNTYDGSVSGFELNNLKSIKKTESYSTETTYITGVDISSTSITEIPQYGFSKCTYLTSITLPNTLTELKYWAFYGCTSLASITLPNSLVYIRADAFYNNPLTSITIPASVKKIDSDAFSKTQISSFTIPSTVEEIARSAFINTPWWNGLSDATIYKDNICFGYKTTKPTGALSITSGTRMIANSAFSFCTGLTSVSLPSTCTSIGNSAFYDSTAISSYSLPKVQHIGTTAFRTNTALTSITLPNTLTYLDKTAFTLCSNLDYIHFSGTTPPSDGNFNNSTKGPALMVPNSSAVATYKAAWPSLQSRIFAEGTTLYRTSVNVSPSGAGTISGTGMYASGDSCTLTASSSRYNFSKWTNSGGTTLGTDPSYTFTVGGNSTINAIFTTKPGSFTEASTTGSTGSTSTYGSGTVYIQLNGTTIATYVFSSSGWTITKHGTWPKEFNIGDRLGCNTQSWTFKSSYSIGVYMGYSNLVLERASKGTSTYTIADSFSGSNVYLYVGIKDRY